MPQAVTAMGIPRTDFGWLGKGIFTFLITIFFILIHMQGIYFGDCFETSGQYCHPGVKGTSFFLLARVALGKVYDQVDQVSSLKRTCLRYN